MITQPTLVYFGYSFCPDICPFDLARNAEVSVKLSAIGQFLPDNGLATTPSNARPWRIVGEGLQGRYTEEDDEFTAYVEFQHPTLVATTGVLVSD